MGNTEYPFIAITPTSTVTRSDNTLSGPIYGLNNTVCHFNYVLMLNWIVWNRIV